MTICVAIEHLCVDSIHIEQRTVKKVAKSLLMVEANAIMQEVEEEEEEEEETGDLCETTSLTCSPVPTSHFGCAIHMHIR